MREHARDDARLVAIARLHELRHLPRAALVALAGAPLALVPGTPTVALDPELALALLVAPVLLDAAVAAGRQRLSALRAEGTIGDDAFHRVEEELDWAELGWAQIVRPEPGAGAAARAGD